MQSPSTRTRKIAYFSAGPLALLVAGGMVWQGSQAAFTASTRNAGNSWETGRVALGDDDQGRAMFTVNGLVPGDSGENCIVVSADSTVSGEVHAYLENLDISGVGLEDNITIGLERGTGGSFGDCTGFVPAEPGSALTTGSLSSVAGDHQDYATGGAVWDTTEAGGETATYRATWEFDPSGDADALQGAQTSVDFVWELQSDGPTAN